MDDISLEYRVVKQKSALDKLIKFGSAAAAVILGILSVMMNTLLIIPAIACAAVFFILVPRLNVEYEYLYVAGELTIDCIYDKKSRKNVANYSMNDLELFAREGEDALSSYGPNCTKKDFSSGEEGKERYVLICRANGETAYVLTEPGEEIVKAIYNRYPNKCAGRYVKN